METWNQSVNNCKLTSFITDHSGIFQNRDNEWIDNSNGNMTSIVDDWKLTHFSGIFQNRDNNNGKITQMETWKLETYRLHSRLQWNVSKQR